MSRQRDSAVVYRGKEVVKSEWATHRVLHPLVVGGDVVCAVGDEEDFGGGDGWWKTEVIEGSILRDS